jgi:signal transduction histidine kinase
MKLRTRLSIATASVATVGSLLAGGAGVWSAFTSEVSRYDKVLQKVGQDAADASGDKITAAIESAADRSFSVKVSLIDTEARVNDLFGAEPEFTLPPTLTEAKSALKAPVSIGGEIPYRLFAVEIDGGDYLLLSMPLAGAFASAQQNILGLIWFVTIEATLSSLLILLLVRRDLKLVEDLATTAKKIAAGEPVKIESGREDTEIAQLSKALEEMVEALERSITVERGAQQAMQRFIGDASHELRTPLTVVKGYVELLGQRGGKDAAFDSKALDRIGKEVVRLEGLINDLLLIAELGEGGLENSRPMTSVNLSALVASMAEDFVALNPQRRVELQIADGLKVQAAEDLLHQLMHNILSNITKHTDGTDAVAIVLSKSRSGAKLTFDDAGPGLTDELYDQGIERFVRFDPFASRQQGSSGLGMTIIRAIVARHSGTVRLAKSELGGLRTEIVLPSKQPKKLEG